MSSPRAPVGPHGGPPTAEAPCGFADGPLEALKWIALASMFVDHSGRHLLSHGSHGWSLAVGRLALLLLALVLVLVLVLALNLACAGDCASRARCTARRRALGRVAGGLAATALGGFCAFGVGGVLLVAAVCAACVHRQVGTALPALALLLATARLNAGIGAGKGWPGTLAGVTVARAVRALPLHMPRR